MRRMLLVEGGTVDDDVRLITWDKSSRPVVGYGEKQVERGCFYNDVSAQNTQEKCRIWQSTASVVSMVMCCTFGMRDKYFL